MKTSSVRVVSAAALLLGLVLGALPILAHHSFAAEYDSNKPVKVSGVVTKVEWLNPHIWFYVDEKTSDGKVTNWAFSGGAPGQLMRRGITKDVIQPGMIRARSCRTASSPDLTTCAAETRRMSGE